MVVTELLFGTPVLPVLVIDDPDSAVQVADTLAEAGFAALEITLRTPGALSAIEQVARRCPGTIVGAGSVRVERQISDSKDAGARFAVSPGSSRRLLDAAEAADMPFVPGAATPSEMLRLFERGFRLQKFFPAEILGGARYLQAVAGPLPEVKFAPTGGIGPSNVAEYTALPNVACVGGTWIAPRAMLRDRQFETIGTIARETIKHASAGVEG